MEGTRDSWLTQGRNNKGETNRPGTYLAGASHEKPLQMVHNNAALDYACASSISSRMEYRSSSSTFFTLSLSRALHGSIFTPSSRRRAIRRSSMLQASG